MAYDLIAIGKRADQSGIVTMSDIVPTKALSNDLARIYLKVWRFWRKEASDVLLPAYGREIARLTADSLVHDEAVDLENQIAAAETRALAVTAVLSVQVDVWEKNLADLHERQFIAYVKQASTIDVSFLISSQAIDDKLKATLQENLRLIRSVSDEARDKIGGAVWRGFLARTPRRDVAKEINRALEGGRARALRISVDQTTKLSAALDEARQTEAGLDTFRWRHSGKVHYRPEHKARDGKLFKWSSNVARTDPPGHAIHCGCKSQPVLDFD